MAVSTQGLIKFTLDKVSYGAGEQVNGVVHLYLEEDYPGNMVYVRIIGEEELMFVKHEGNSSRTYEQKTNILDHEFPVYQFNTFGGIPRGMYSFPVSFVLPSYIPATMFEKKGLDFGKISYKMKARLPLPNEQEIPPVMSSVNFYVKNSDVPTPTKSTFVQKDVRCFCCIPRGQCSISVQFEKANYAFGEEAGIIVDIDNSKCRVAAKEISADLINYLFLRIKDKTETKRNVVGTIKIPGVKAGEVKSGIRLPLKIKHHIFKKGSLNPTSIGSSVKNTYFIQVKPYMDTCVCGSEPKTSIYVNICHRDTSQNNGGNGFINQTNPFASNFEWKPQVMDAYVAKFKPEYAKSDLNNFDNNRMAFQGNVNYPMSSPQGPILNEKGKEGDYTSMNN